MRRYGPQGTSARALTPLALLSVGAFGALKLVGYLVWKISGEGSQLRLSLDSVSFAVLVSVGLGAMLGVLCKTLQIARSDENVKSIGVGAIGLCVLTGVCSIGACALPLLLSTLASLVLFIPVAIGIKLTGLVCLLRHGAGVPKSEGRWVRGPQG